MKTLTAKARPAEGDRIEILAPAVGLYRHAPRRGASVQAGEPIGQLEVLGALYEVLAPDGVAGAVLAVDRVRARRPVGYGEPLFVVDPRADRGASHRPAETHRPAPSEGGLVFHAPMAGRFYGRPAPSEPPFVTAGAEIATGHTVGLLEVMKTFNRVAYGGEGLPARARVRSVLVADGDDLAARQPMLELEPL